VILVGEAAAGPADVGNFEFPKCGDHVIPDPARIRNRRIGTDPNALVESVSKILSKLSEEVAIDPGSRLRNIDG
jgi:hypothetical protein